MRISDWSSDVCSSDLTGATRPMEQIVNAHRDALDPRVEGEASSRSITRTGSDLKTLSPRALEDRKLIHRNDSVRSQADSFRGLRPKLPALGSTEERRVGKECVKTG